MKNYVYSFGGGTADGSANMKNLLGGKGANLAEMNHLDIPVPPGFTITTDVCQHYYNYNQSLPGELETQVDRAIVNIEEIMGAEFGDTKNPLLVSVRSGARQSMPGMMETVLNVGLTTHTIPGLIHRTNNKRFVYDTYRRLIMMYSDVVMEKAAGKEPDEGQGIRQRLEERLEEYKKEKNYLTDTDLTSGDLETLVSVFKKEIKSILGEEFPDNPNEQLWGGIKAVFQSWNGTRAQSYRRFENIPNE